MAKEILLYSGLNNYVAREIITALHESLGKEVTMRENSPGGDVFSTWGIKAKIVEHGNVHIKVDGAAFSDAANLVLYAKSAEALSVSRFMFHRASMDSPNAEQQIFLNGVNADLKNQMTSRIDSTKLKAMKGISIEELFNPESKTDLFLTAQEAKELGIISKVVELNPTEMKAMNETFLRIAAEHNPEIQNPTNMTLDKLKAEHPALYAEIVAAAEKNGVTAERTRVKAWLAFAGVDPEAVGKGIAEGVSVDMAVIAEMQVKMFSKEGLSKLKADSTKTVATKASAAPEAGGETTEKEQENDLFVQAAIDLALGNGIAPAKKVEAKVVA